MTELFDVEVHADGDEVRRYLVAAASVALAEERAIAAAAETLQARVQRIEGGGVLLLSEYDGVIAP